MGGEIYGVARAAAALMGAAALIAARKKSKGGEPEMKKLKGLASLLAGVLLIAPAAACAGEEGYAVSEKTTPVAYKSVYFDFLGGKDVMPIGGFFGPYVSHEVVINCENFPDYYSDDIFQKIADSGVNAIVYYNTRIDIRIELLEQGEKFGVGIFVKDEELNPLLDDYTAMAHTFVPEDIDMNEFSRRMLEYAEYDSCLGLHVRDEAFTYHLDELKGIFDVYNSLGFHNKHVISNTIGYMGSNNVYTGWQYVITAEEYYEKFFETGCTTFSTTMYPYDETDEDKALEDMLDGLSINREMANKYDVPLWRMLQAGAQWNDAGAWIESAPEPYPTEGQMLLDVNAALTYGAKGNPVLPAHPAHVVFQGGRLQPRLRPQRADRGQRRATRWYYYAQKANKQIAAVGPCPDEQREHGRHRARQLRHADDGRRGDASRIHRRRVPPAQERIGRRRARGVLRLQRRHGAVCDQLQHDGEKAGHAAFRQQLCLRSDPARPVGQRIRQGDHSHPRGGRRRACRRQMTDRRKMPAAVSPRAERRERLL